MNPRLLGAALLSAERFTMDGEAGCTTKDGFKLSFALNAFEESRQGMRFTGMFPHAGMTKKARRLAD